MTQRISRSSEQIKLIFNMNKLSLIYKNIFLFKDRVRLQRKHIEKYTMKNSNLTGNILEMEIMLGGGG